MPGRVEFHLESIFDVPGDLLVIPSSAGGTIPLELQMEIREAGIPLPEAMPWGTVRIYTLPNKLWKAVAYAAVLSPQQTTSAGILRKIGRQLGQEAAIRKLGTLVTPLLGADASNLSYEVAAMALTLGFSETAPDTAVLLVNIRAPEMFTAVTDNFSRAGIGELSAGGTAVRPGLPLIRKVRNDVQIDLVPESTQVPLTAAPSVRKRVFISYSHADAEWLKRLQKHLKPLEREGVEVWDDTRLRPGEPWREEIRTALEQTKVAILLVSADFLASDFIVTNELPPLLKAAEDDGAIILPVIISPSRFQRTESLSRFQAVNDPAKPLVQLRRANREKVLDDVARAVEDALNR